MLYNTRPHPEELLGEPGMCGSLGDSRTVTLRETAAGDAPACSGSDESDFVEAAPPSGSRCGKAACSF